MPPKDWQRHSNPQMKHLSFWQALVSITYISFMVILTVGLGLAQCCSLSCSIISLQQTICFWQVKRYTQATELHSPCQSTLVDRLNISTWQTSTQKVLVNWEHFFSLGLYILCFCTVRGPSKDNIIFFSSMCSSLLTELEEVQRCLFADSLVTVSDTGRELGEFCISIQKTIHNNQPCFLVHANSHGAIDNIPCGTSITGESRLMWTKNKSSPVYFFCDWLWGK